MLDPVYFAVSGVMWCWHQLFGFLLGLASGLAWALSVVFLVLTLRALLIRPFLAQVRSGRAIAPQLRARHADDPARLVQETRALQQAHGVSTAGTILPALLQMPVFLGLLHVLTHFNRRGLTFEQNAALSLRHQPADGPLGAIMPWTPWVFPHVIPKAPQGDSTHPAPTSHRAGLV